VRLGPRLRRKTVALALLVLGIGVAGMWHGGVEARAALPVVLATLAAAFLAWPRSGSGTIGGGTQPDRRLPLLPLGLFLGTIAIALQLAPLSPSLLRLLSPNAVRLFEETLAPIGRWPAWRPLSLAPGETGFLLLVAAGVAGGCIAASFLGEKHHRADALLKALSWTGLAASLAGMLGSLLGWGRLLESRVTFINPNHLAGFLQLGAWPAFGFALRARGRERVGWLGAFAFTSVGIFLTLSRGGITAFFVSAGVSAVLAVLHGHTPFTRSIFGGERRRKRRRALDADPAPDGPPADSSPAATGSSLAPEGPAESFGWRRLLRRMAVPVGMALALAVAAWLALDPIVSEMRTVTGATQEVKVQMWPDGVRLARQFLLTGIGRGAFATVFPSLKTETMQVTFSHLENTWLQLPVDMGLFVGVALIGLFAWAWVAAARQRDLSRPMLGALAGAAGLAAHNVVDFSFELLGVALPFAVVLGLASRAMPRVRVPRAAGLAGVGLLLLLGTGGLLVNRLDAGRDVAEKIAGPAPPPVAPALAGAALAWRPADWLPPAAAGVRIVAAGKCGEGLPWLVRAMVRNPTAPEPHRYAARCLWAGGKEALAKREFRLAFLYGDTESLAEADFRFPDPGELLEIAPETKAGLLAAAHLLTNRPEEAREALKRAWEQYLDPRALAGLARVTLQLGDADEALTMARQLQRLKPDDPDGWLVAGAALQKQGDPDAGLAEVEKGLPYLPGKASLLGPLGQRYLAMKRPSQARSIFEQIVARTGPEQSRKKLLVAAALAAQGRMVEALSTAQDAAAADRSDARPLEALSAYAAAAGRYELAIDALERSKALPNANLGAYEERLAKLKAGRLERELRTKQ
jgi:tetratricopeptide (TPR) repeat protein